ncbi:MAG: hypothetical protein NZ853_01290 [Leptospiraceae bacterium]|nr:hypothetical protein [Leptospiraceae bacterium]MDW7976138.1 hypothetical protein [Leptospiraceae bacterium]
MKYYYKTPEQVKKEIEEYIREHKKSPYNKTFWMIFLNILIIVIVLFILEKSGLLIQQKSKAIQKISYTIQDQLLILNFELNHEITIASEMNEKNIFFLEEIQFIYMHNQNSYNLRFQPTFTKKKLSKENPKLIINLPNFVSTANIYKVIVRINHQNYEAEKQPR